MYRSTTPKTAIAALGFAAAWLWLAACAPQGGPGGGDDAPPAAALVGPEWVVDDIAGGGIVEGSRATLRFGEDGSVGGRASCNSYSAQYQQAGEALTIGQAASTMMACAQPLMEQERRFFDLLAATASYRIDASGALVLSTADGRTIRARRA
jgi:heat shock protein HslJ